MCGLHFVDLHLHLHLREGAACAQCRSAHLHVCHRDGLINGARAKTKRPWAIEDGVVCGGLIKRVSPAMVHSYFAYMTTEYPRTAAHGMLLVQQHGPDTGLPWTPEGARGMIQRTARRAGLGLVKPHAFRHSFATAVLDAAGGNLVVAKEAGGWASAGMVDEVYGHADVHDPVFDRALRAVWGQ